MGIPAPPPRTRYDYIYVHDYEVDGRLAEGYEPVPHVHPVITGEGLLSRSGSVHIFLRKKVRDG